MVLADPVALYHPCYLVRPSDLPALAGRFHPVRLADPVGLVGPVGRFHPVRLVRPVGPVGRFLLADPVGRYE